MDTNKTKNMLLFFIENGSDLSITKVMKLFFYSDFVAFSRTGSSISGLDYHSWDRGPVPPVLHSGLKKDRFEYVRLENTGRALIVRAVQDVVCDPSVFSASEKEILDSVFNFGRDVNASQLSELTHSLVPWAKTELYGKISYEWTQLQKAIQREGLELEDEEIILDVIKRNPQLHHFYECGLSEWLEASADSDYDDLIDEESLTPVHWEHGTGWVQRY